VARRRNARQPGNAADAVAAAAVRVVSLLDVGGKRRSAPHAAAKIAAPIGSFRWTSGTSGLCFWHFEKSLHHGLGGEESVGLLPLYLLLCRTILTMG